MLVAKIIICILTFVALVIASVLDGIKGDIVRGFAGVLGSIFCILILNTNWNLFAIPKVLLFITVCLYIVLLSDYEKCYPGHVALVITIIAYVIAGGIYMSRECSKTEYYNTPDVKTTSCPIICAKDNFSIEGSISGGIFCVQGSVSEKSVYRYYYQLEDGGIKLGTIPVDSTTI